MDETSPENTRTSPVPIAKGLLDLTEGGGEMGKLIQEVDWSQSSVGPFEQWPQSLKTALSICLGSKFPMFVWWGKDLTVFYNDSYIPFTGLKHPTYLGRPAREQWAEIWDALEPLTEQVLTTGKATWAESMLLFMNRKGFLEETYFTFSYSPIRDESGGVGGIINPCQETTERILSERRLKTLHKLATYDTKNLIEMGEPVAHALGSNTADIPFMVIYMTEEDGKTLKLVGSSGVVEGSAAAPLRLDLTKNSQDIWHLGRVRQSKKPERVDGLRQRIFADLPNEPYEEKPDAAYVLPMILPNHESPTGYLVMGLSPRLAFDESYQEFYGLICRNIINQIVNYRALESEKKRAESLAELDRAKTDFFSNVSHEFRTPLTLMLGPVENILLKNAESLTPELRDDLDLVYRNSLRLLKLVNTLLDFSRIQANRVHAHYEPVDLASHTAYLASAFDTAVERAGMKLTVECLPLPQPIYIDKDMWEKIVLNLISNAFKYTLQGEITVTLRRVAGAAELKVRDTGTGIPENEIPKIFQRFHRVHGAKGRTHEGSGIGLSLVKELVDLHGGQISVQSKLGEGTTFTVRIPEGSAHLPADRITEANKNSKSTFAQTDAFVSEALRWLPEPTRRSIPLSEVIGTPSSEEKTGSRKKIVLADDNADMRDYLRRLLAEHYDVTTVTNGQEALNEIIARRPDILVSDVMMPVMDGLELIKKIRESQLLQTLPIILLSARAGEEATIQGVEMGADDYLTKPFSTLELLARIKTQLSLADMRKKMLSELEFSNKELDSFAYSVSHDLRAPLRAISGFTHILREDFKENFNTEALEYFSRIERAAGQMSKLVDGLLELSRYSRYELQMKEVDLSEGAEQIISNLQMVEPARDVEVKIQKGVKGYGDPRMLGVVLENLIRNAWKYSSQVHPSKIEFGAELDKDGNLVYFVKDNGAGFDMAHVGRLFRAFERLHSNSQFEGTGIGLATVQRIITRHGGRIWVQAKVDEGAQFYFTLGSASES